MSELTTNYKYTVVSRHARMTVMSDVDGDRIMDNRKVFEIPKKRLLQFINSSIKNDCMIRSWVEIYKKENQPPSVKG